MRRAPLCLAIALATAVAACGARSGLLGDGFLSSSGGSSSGGSGSSGSSSGGQDASVLDDAASALPTLPDGAPLGPPIAIQTCPQAARDACGTNMYQAGATWPTYQRCSSHDAHTGIVGPANPVLKWSYGAETLVVAGPPTVGADGTIYYTSAGSLVAVHPDGTPSWRATLTTLDTGSSTVAVGPDGSVFASLDRVYALDSHGGFEWSSFSLNVPGATSVFGALGSSGSSVALGPCGTLDIGSELGLLLFDQSGGEVWDHPGQGLTPAIDANGIAYYGAADGRLFAITPRGEELWTFVRPVDAGPSGGWIQPAPVLGPDGTIFYGATDGLYAISREGKEKWRLAWGAGTLVASLASVALGADGTLYLASPDSTLDAVSPDGKLEWSLPIAIAGTAPIVDGHGTIYELGLNGVYAVTPGGQIAWSIPIQDALGGALALGADGTLYVTTSGLYAIGEAARH